MKAGRGGLTVVFIGHILGDLAWYSVLSLLVSRGRRFLNDRRYRVLIGVCGGVLAFFGLSFLFRAFGMIFRA